MKEFDRDKMLAEADLGSTKVRLQILVVTAITLVLMFGGIAYFLYR